MQSDMDCCHHHEHKTRRKFICNFAALSANASNQCLEMERSRCRAFWKLIDQRDELKSFIRSGEFEHINAPQIVEATIPKDVSIQCRSSDELRAKNKALHDEERERINKRKQILDELQKRSGQLSCTRPQEKCGRSSDKISPAINFAQIVEEMNEFDKRFGSPELNSSSTSNNFNWEANSPNNEDEEEMITSPAASIAGESSGEEEISSETGRMEPEPEEFAAEDQQEDGVAVTSGESGESLRA